MHPKFHLSWVRRKTSSYSKMKKGSLYEQPPLVEYYEEVTDDEDYKEDDDLVSVESDSSAAESMLDKDFETTNPLKIDQALQQISTGL